MYHSHVLLYDTYEGTGQAAARKKRTTLVTAPFAVYAGNCFSGGKAAENAEEDEDHDEE